MYKFQTHESDADDSDVLRLVQNVWYLAPLTITMFNWPWQELSRLRTGQPKEIKRRFVLRLEFFARVFWLWKMCQKSLYNNRLTLFSEVKSLHSVADNIQWNGWGLIIIIIGYRQVAFCHSAVAALSVRFDITETHSSLCKCWNTVSHSLMWHIGTGNFVFLRSKGSSSFAKAVSWLNGFEKAIFRNLSLSPRNILKKRQWSWINPKQHHLQRAQKIL